MPFDAMFLSAVCDELRQELIGARVEKIQQPARDMVVLQLRGKARLLLSASGSRPRFHVTQASYENPAQPPMFCMLLRKHLAGGRIAAIEQPPAERSVELTLDCTDEMGTPCQKRLILELMGRNSNLILTDGENRILDCMRRVDFEMSEQRQVLPGLFYHRPPRQEGKLTPQELTEPALERLLAQTAAPVHLDRWIVDHVAGISPLIAREMEFRGAEKSPAGAAAFERKPYMLVENGEPKDFSFMEILQYGPSVTCVEYPGWSALLEAFWGEKDRRDHLRSRGKSLSRLVRGARNRTEKKLGLRRQELAACADREEFKRRGDLITANIWRMKKGMDTLVCEDFYAEGSPAVSIALDPRKTPQQNAAACYRQYTKKKAAEEHLTALIEENAAELEYLGSVADELERAREQQDLADISAELEAGGYIRAAKGKKKSRPAAPLSYRTESGREILVGRNNVQNDELTFRLARRTDIWLHAQKIHGAHVILRCEGAEPLSEDIRRAAELAAFHSEAAQSARVPVDYTLVRFVKKPRGARAGMVIYTDQRTILAEPKENA